MTIDLRQGDCLQILPTIPDHSIDLILCDLPYGITACKWDCPIDLGQLWVHYKRVLKPYRPVVLFGRQPFSSGLIMRNPEWFRYEWIWVKNRPTNFVHAKNKPMKKHENILVFREGTTAHEGKSDRRMPYYPQGLVPTNSKKLHDRVQGEYTRVCFEERPRHRPFVREFTNYPHTILEYGTDINGDHPTAKPVKLLEYLIRTYSSVGDVVLDNCMGGGRTGVACANTGRSFIGIELDQDYFLLSCKRIGYSTIDPSS